MAVVRGDDNEPNRTHLAEHRCGAMCPEHGEAIAPGDRRYYERVGSDTSSNARPDVPPYFCPSPSCTHPNCDERSHWPDTTQQED